MATRRRLILVLVLAAFSVAWWTQAKDRGLQRPGASHESDWMDSDMTVPSHLRGETRAPEFPAGADWLNVSRPLKVGDLKGKVVLLDFWTFCCINCMHVIPDLKKLEAKYPDSLVVVGVHSAKFTGEKDTRNIRDAVLRYGLEHPVVNDADFKLWNAYGIRAWPSFALLDPTGKVVGLTSGEGVYDQLEPLIGGMVAAFDREGKLDRSPLPFLHPERGRKPLSLLSYPGKVAVDERGRRLFVSDSNHNRLLVLSPEGEVRDVIGDGTEGAGDGDFASASFFRPQGLAYDPDRDGLYVADTENHRIRWVDLKSRKVATLAGTGRQAPFQAKGGLAKTADLNSPWDLTKVGGDLYVAMAGSHQIWKLDLASGTIGVFAGSGREGLTDGFLPDAALAQPSGIVSDGHKLYFADSETSSIRMADLDPKGRVDTLVGTGLFDYGDRDGERGAVRLQHPIGLALRDGRVLVADTYNNKIKWLDPKARKVTTWLGGAGAGWADGVGPASAFDEPCGLAFGWGKWFVADTNNHALRVVDPATGKTSTLMLRGLSKLLPRGTPAAGPTGPALPGVTASPGETTLRVMIQLPEGTEINPQAPSRLVLSSSDSQVGSLPESLAVTAPQIEAPIRLRPGSTTLTADLTLYYCSHGNAALCFFYSGRVSLPLKVVPRGAGALRMSFSPLGEPTAPKTH